MGQTKVQPTQTTFADGWCPALGIWTPLSQGFTNNPASGTNIELNMADTSGWDIGDIITVMSPIGSENARITVVHTGTHLTVESLSIDHTTGTARFASTLFVEQPFTNDPSTGTNKQLNMSGTSGFNIGDFVEVSSSGGREYSHIIAVTGTYIIVDKLEIDHTVASATNYPMVKQVVQNTFIIDTSVDLSSQITVGDKIRYVDGSTKYGIVVAISGTRITIYGGTDYTPSSSSPVTSPYFSHVKSPFGFPMALEKWTVRFTDMCERTQNTPTTNVWYNLNSIYISIPKGSWLVSYKCTPDAKDTATINVQLYTTLSTINNGVSSSDFTVMTYLVAVLNGITRMFVAHFAQSQITLTARTAYYMNLMSVMSGLDSMGFYNIEATGSKMLITAVCAYL